MMSIDKPVESPPARPAGVRRGRSAATASVRQAEGWAVAALRALDAPCLVMNALSGRLAWAAPAFATVARTRALTYSALCQDLPGLAEAVACAATQAGWHTTHVQLGERLVEAQVQWLDDSHWLLRLTNRAEEAQARQRHLEDREQLLFTSRVLSIGEMATTLAHEINQPIGAAANLLRGMQMRMQRQASDGGSAASQQALHTALLPALQRAVDQVMFASKVVARIREYTHLHAPQRKPVDVAAVVRACAGLLDWETEREGVAVQLQLPDGPLWVQADELMLQQVLVNLMRNAIDAMRGNPPGERRLSLSARLEGPQAEVVVCDCGSGISEQAERSLFTPFVSSKPTGTGIGLNICRSFIELHRGRLWFSRNPDRGICFHASLPLAPSHAMHATHATQDSP